MGTTDVIATLSAVASAPTTVIVKPEEFSTTYWDDRLPHRWRARTKEPEIYYAASGSPNMVNVFTDAGGTYHQLLIFNAGSAGGSMSMRQRGNVAVWNSYIPGYNDVRIMTSTGTLVNTWELTTGCSFPNGVHITEDGQIWAPEFLWWTG